MKSAWILPALCLAGCAGAPSPAPTPGQAAYYCALDNTNVARVAEAGSAPTFRLSSPGRLAWIETYHWNSGKGKPPGRIGLRDAAGRAYGPWPATATAGTLQAPNVNWKAEPPTPVQLGVGQYTVLDSDPATWSQNFQSQGQGFARVWLAR